MDAEKRLEILVAMLGRDAAVSILWSSVVRGLHDDYPFEASAKIAELRRQLGL